MSKTAQTRFPTKKEMMDVLRPKLQAYKGLFGRNEIDEIADSIGKTYQTIYNYFSNLGKDPETAQEILTALEKAWAGKQKKQQGEAKTQTA